MNGPLSDPSDDSDGAPTIHTGYDWAQTPPMMAVLEAVSDAKNVRPTDLPSLHSSVPPDALDALFQRAPDGPNGEGIRVDFSYAGREVAVKSGGNVVVTPRWGVD